MMTIVAFMNFVKRYMIPILYFHDISQCIYNLSDDS